MWVNLKVMKICIVSQFEHKCKCRSRSNIVPQIWSFLESIYWIVFSKCFVWSYFEYTHAYTNNFSDMHLYTHTSLIQDFKVNLIQHEWTDHDVALAIIIYIWVWTHDQRPQLHIWFHESWQVNWKMNKIDKTKIDKQTREKKKYLLHFYVFTS